MATPLSRILSTPLPLTQTPGGLSPSILLIRRQTPNAKFYRLAIGCGNGSMHIRSLCRWRS